MTQNKFPTEIIELPSKGHFYPEDNPLSSGKVEMKYMTAREEDILTSVNLIKSGKALDKLLESLIIDKKIDFNDLLVGDKNALLIGARILAYGKEYSFSFLDIHGEIVKAKADLTQLKEKELDFSNYDKGVNLFSSFIKETIKLLLFFSSTYELRLIFLSFFCFIRKL